MLLIGIMDFNELFGKIEKYIYDKYSRYTEEGGGYNYRYFHAIRVHNMALRYIKTSNIKVDINSLRIACILHDIGKLKFVRGDKIDLGLNEELHTIEGAKRSKEILKNFGVGDDRMIEKVSKIILEHHECTNKNKETEILQNSDNVWVFFAE